MSVTAKDYKFMKISEKYISESLHERYKLSALIVKSGSIISYGVNRPAPKPYFVIPNKGEMGRHAECDALLGLDRKAVKGSVMYISGRTKANNMITSFSCPSCRDLAFRMGIKKIYYHDRQGNINCYKIR